MFFCQTCCELPAVGKKLRFVRSGPLHQRNMYLTASHSVTHSSSSSSSCSSSSSFSNSLFTLLVSCSFLPPPLPLPHHSGPVLPVFFYITLHGLLCMCVFLPVWLCVYSNLSKHSLVWELRDPLCLVCGVRTAWTANPSHTLMHAFTLKHTHTHPLGFDHRDNVQL